MPWFRLLIYPLFAALVVVGLIALFTRNNEASTPSLRDVLADVDPGPIHVHGLGIDPGSGALLIATHTGTYRVAPDERKAKLIGKSRQDTMGFTIAGPGYFLGSGHPDPNEARTQGLPPLLGLIESRDEGQTWSPVSLSGQADFHVLRFAGDVVYGYDSSNDRLLVSGDTGRTWSKLARPAPLFDLVVDPGRRTNLAATTEVGVFVSTNGAHSWSRASSKTGLLSWPRPKLLYLVEFSGRVLTSSEPTGRWTPVGDIAGGPAALLAQSPRELYVALHDGTIKRSSNGGRTWRIRSTP